MCKVFSESGKPCGFEPCEEYKHLDDAYRRVMDNSTTLQDERDELLEKARELEAEISALRQDRDRLAGIVKKADALYQASKIQCFRKEFERAQDAYQEARHG